MGSFVWPMLTFLLTTKLGFSDGTATLLIATAGLVSLPVALLGGKLADKFQRKNVIIVFDILTVFMSLLAFLRPSAITRRCWCSSTPCFRPWNAPPMMP